MADFGAGLWFGIGFGISATLVRALLGGVAAVALRRVPWLRGDA